MWFIFQTLINFEAHWVLKNDREKYRSSEDTSKACTYNKVQWEPTSWQFSHWWWEPGKLKGVQHQGPKLAWEKSIQVRIICWTVPLWRSLFPEEQTHTSQWHKKSPEVMVAKNYLESYIQHGCRKNSPSRQYGLGVDLQVRLPGNDVNQLCSKWGRVHCLAGKSRKERKASNQCEQQRNQQKAPGQGHFSWSLKSSLQLLRCQREWDSECLSWMKE